MTHDANSDSDAARRVAAILAEWYGRTRRGAPRHAERARRLLDALGHVATYRVVHVVGTNGKGSVAARIDAGLRAWGLRTVRFTSPHVERFQERIAVHGRDVEDGVLAPVLERVHALPAAKEAPFFDLTTVLAAEVAADQQADVLVLEAGVGAARDATLAVGNVVVSVVTNVEEDHLATIGPTLADVARDKAEAIRPGVPCVTGAVGVGLEVVAQTCLERHAPLVRVPRPEACVGSGVAEHAAALAIATLEAGFGVTARGVVEEARRDPRLPARREWFVLPGDRKVLLDGAHNPPAAMRLALDVPAGAHALIGVASRKDVGGVLAAFAHLPVVTRTVAVEGDAVDGGGDGVVMDAHEALSQALAHLPEGGTLVVTGSFYLAGTVRPWLRARHVDAMQASWPGTVPGYAPRS